MPWKSREEKALRQYKQVLASILPQEFLTQDGFLKRPCGGGEPIRIVPPAKPSWLERISMLFFGGGPAVDSPGARYVGGLQYKILRHLMLRSRCKLPEREYAVLESYVDKSLKVEGDGDDVIDLRTQKRSTSLAHEAFHDIQGYLLDHYPDIYDKLQHGVQQRKEAIEAWYSDPSSAVWTTWRDYSLRQLFPSCHSQSPYKLVRPMIVQEGYERLRVVSNHIEDIAVQAQMEVGRAEAIPVLLAAAAGGNATAAEILSEIFGEAGLRSDFAGTLPRW